MKKILGGMFTASGLFGVIYFSYQYFQGPENFQAFGTDVMISSGDYTPIIISTVILGVGILVSKINFR